MNTQHIIHQGNSTCRLFNVPRRLLRDDSTSAAARVSTFEKYIFVMCGWRLALVPYLSTSISLTYPLPRENIQPKERAHQALHLKGRGSSIRRNPLVHLCDHDCNLFVSYKSFQASEHATPLRVARSKTLFSEERWVEKQINHNGTEDISESFLRIKTMNDILQKLWDLKVQETVGSWRRAAVHPRRQGGERQEDIYKLLGANDFAVDNA